MAEGHVVLFPHRADGWRLGRVLSGPPPPWERRREQCVVCDALEEEHNVEARELVLIHDERRELREPAGDLLVLPRIHEGIALHHLRAAFADGRCCLALGGDIVVVCNPYTTALPGGPLYSEQRADEWSRPTAAPAAIGPGGRAHPYGVARRCFRRLLEGRDSSILVTGESGAGKTETAKALMHYFGRVSASQSCRTAADRQTAAGLAARVMATNAILEAFGNAKTVRNDNSSRFGKYITLHFSAEGALQGADCRAYLLEKSRVVRHGNRERGFHVFYALLRGAGAAELARLRLTRPQDYVAMRPGATNRPGALDDAAFFRDICRAMDGVGVQQQEREAVWGVLAAVLHLLNIEFREGRQGAEVVDPEPLEACQALLGVPTGQLAAALTTATLTVQGERVLQRLSVAKATAGRDGLCKWMYAAVFHWLLDRINASLGPQTPGVRRVGLLDMFGFEDFATGNCFEQLLINFANETLQGFYDDRLFRELERECREEGVSFEQPPHGDNSQCLELLGGRQGLLKLLDDECALSGLKASDANFAQQLHSQFIGPKGESKHPRFSRPKVSPGLRFAVHHYAGAVEYSAEGAVAKNSDPVRDDLVSLVAQAQTVAARLLARGAAVAQAQSAAAEAPAGGSPRGKERAVASTVAGTFRQQMRELVAVLGATEPYWCRCVKPNADKRPGVFDGALVLSQLNHSGVVPTLRLLRSGPRPYPLELFAGDFRCLARGAARDGDPRAVAAAVQQAQALPAAQLQLGKSKVFLTHDARTALLAARSACLRGAAGLLCRAGRGLRGRLRLAAARAERARRELAEAERRRRELERLQWARLDEERARDLAAAVAQRDAEHRGALARLGELEALEADRREWHRMAHQLLESAAVRRARIDAARREQDEALVRGREGALLEERALLENESRRHQEAMGQLEQSERAARERQQRGEREAALAEQQRRARQREQAMRQRLREAAQELREVERAKRQELRQRQQEAAAACAAQCEAERLQRRERQEQRERSRRRRRAASEQRTMAALCARRGRCERELAAEADWQSRRRIWLEWEADERGRAQQIAAVRARTADLAARQLMREAVRSERAVARLSQHRRDTNRRLLQSGSSCGGRRGAGGRASPAASRRSERYSLDRSDWTPCSDDQLLSLLIAAPA